MYLANPVQPQDRDSELVNKRCLLGEWTVEDGEVTQEACVQFRHARRRVGIDGSDVADVGDVAPRVLVGIVEAAVVDVLTHQLDRRLVVKLVHLQVRTARQALEVQVRAARQALDGEGKQITTTNTVLNMKM